MQFAISHGASAPNHKLASSFIYKCPTYLSPTLLKSIFQNLNSLIPLILAKQPLKILMIPVKSSSPLGHLHSILLQARAAPSGGKTTYKKAGRTGSAATSSHTAAERSPASSFPFPCIASPARDPQVGKGATRQNVSGSMFSPMVSSYRFHRSAAFFPLPFVRVLVKSDEAFVKLFEHAT